MKKQQNVGTKSAFTLFFFGLGIYKKPSPSPPV